MPGFNIHLAVAKQYIKKHKGEIKDEKEFLQGTIRPDLNDNLTELCENKVITHYGQMGNKNNGKFETDIYQFLNDKEIDITTDFYKGYLLHLLTDYCFYNKYFKNEFLEVIQNKDKFHYDFDCLNKMLEEKFEIELSETLKRFTGYKEGSPKYLEKNKLLFFIEEMSSINLDKEIEFIKNESKYKNKL